MEQSAGQERPSRMLGAEKRLRQAVFSVNQRCPLTRGKITSAGVGVGESEQPGGGSRERFPNPLAGRSSLSLPFHLEWLG